MRLSSLLAPALLSCVIAAPTAAQQASSNLSAQMANQRVQIEVQANISSYLCVVLANATGQTQHYVSGFPQVLVDPVLVAFGFGGTNGRYSTALPVNPSIQGIPEVYFEAILLHEKHGFSGSNVQRLEAQPPGNELPGTPGGTYRGPGA